MPELMEVRLSNEFIVPHIVGHELLGVEFITPLKRLARHGWAPPQKWGRLQSSTTRGKHIIWSFESAVIVIHFSMTGVFLLPGCVSRYGLAANFKFDNLELRLEDLRKFAWIWAGPWSHDSHSMPDQIQSLGPEADTVSLEELTDLLAKNHTRIIKAFLLDQTVLAGLGNIMVDEILFDAGIHPKKRIGSLSLHDARMIHQGINTILARDYQAGGASTRIWIRPDGSSGNFQQQTKVYDHRGESCPKCTEPIKFTVAASRSTYYCPRCQSESSGQTVVP